jgi:hypothetical protein
MYYVTRPNPPSTVLLLLWALKAQISPEIFSTICNEVSKTIFRLLTLQDFEAVFSHPTVMFHENKASLGFTWERRLYVGESAYVIKFDSRPKCFYCSNHFTVPKNSNQCIINPNQSQILINTFFSFVKKNFSKMLSISNEKLK